MHGLASLDGRILKAAEATIPVTDDGLLRGDGAFEVLRLYAGRPFALEDHLQRLAHSTAGIRLEADLTALRAEVDELLGRAEPVDAILRIVVTRGGRRILTVEPLPRHPPTLRLATVEEVPSRLLSGLKTLSYAGNMLANRLAAAQGADQAAIVAFGGEEEGLLGSKFYTNNPAFPLDKTAAMINLDMVGRLKDDKLIIQGVDTAPQFAPVIDRLSKQAGFQISKKAGGFGPSDHSSFYSKKVPVMHFFTDIHSDYHKPSDDLSLPMDLAAVEKFTRANYLIAKSIADDPVDPTWKPGSFFGKVFGKKD